MKFKAYLFYSTVKEELYYFSSCLKTFLLTVVDNGKVVYGMRFDKVIKKVKNLNREEIINVILSKRDIWAEKESGKVYYLDFGETSCKIDLERKILIIGGFENQLSNNVLKMDIEKFKNKYLPKKIIKTKGGGFIVY